MSCQSVPSIVWGKCTMSHICKPATDRIAKDKNSKTDHTIGELPVLLLLLLLRLCKSHVREVQSKLADLKSLLDGWQLSVGLPRQPPAAHCLSTVRVMGKMRACRDAGQCNGPKSGGCCAPLRGWGAESPYSTMSPGPKPTSVPSGILIHPAVWP